jgi:DEAD/DEAH box helicase
MNLRHFIAETPAGGVGTFAQELPSTTAKSPRIEPEPSLRRSRDEVMDNESKATSSVVKCPDQDVLANVDEAPPLYLTTVEAQRLAGTTAMEHRDSDGATEIMDVTNAQTVSWAEALQDDAVVTTTRLSTLSQTLLRNLQRMGCEYPLATQKESSRWIRSGANDVVVGTSTGTGKTLAVVVPVLHRLFSLQNPKASVALTAHESPYSISAEHATKRGTDQSTPTAPRMPLWQVLIIAPGRELASQIASVARDLVQDTGWNVVLAVGGTTFTRNVQTIRQRHPQILIGTPGRLAELIVGDQANGGGGKKRGGAVLYIFLSCKRSFSTNSMPC